MARLCTSPYTDSPFIPMYQEVNYESGLSFMDDRYCHLMDSGALSEDVTKVDIKLC